MGNFPTSAYKTAISKIPQTNYLTKTAAAANAFVEENIKSPERTKTQGTESDNTDYVTGYDQPTDSWMEDWKTPNQWQMDLASQNIGRYLLASMGQVSSALLETGAYSHTFLPLDRETTVQLPAYALVEHLSPANNGVNKLIPSMVAKSFQISSSGKAKLDGTVQWEGSGEVVEPSAVTWATHVNPIQGALNYFFARQSELIRSDTDGQNSVNVKCDLKSWQFGVQNEFAEDDYGCPRFLDDDPEKGALRSHYLLTKQTFTQNWAMKLQANSPEHQHLMDRKELKIVTKMIGGEITGGYNHQLEITSFLSKYAAVEDSFEDGFAVVNLSPKMLFDVSANKIVEVKLQTNIAAFNV